MTIAILYLIAIAYVFWSTHGAYQLNTTHILMAAGIIGICSKLYDIQKEIGRANHAE